jgi:hypothetical protein
VTPLTTETDRPGEVPGNSVGALGALGALGGLFPRVSRDIATDSILYRVPLAVAMLSVAFEEWVEDVAKGWKSEGADAFGVDLLNEGLNAGLIFCAVALCLFPKSSRLGVALFILTAAFTRLPIWMGLANHTWLALWTIPMAVVFKDWWRSDLYALYLRVTLGVVMLAAFAQKVLAGTYVDGSYIYWLSTHGDTTERMFSFACDLSAGVPCLAYKLIGQFILVWQFAVGVLLLLGVRSLIFLTIEVGFLLGAGLFADEMNFQVLNIALLCVVFQVGMPIWLIISCLLLLVIDVFQISYLLTEMLQYVSSLIT